MENIDVNSEENTSKVRFKFLDLIYAPISCLTSIPPIVLLVILLVVSGVGTYCFYTINTDYFGLLGPDFSEYSVIGAYQGFSGSDGHSWMISYEYDNDSVFEGVVRKIYPIRDKDFPLLTHDILVTTGDFADPNVVNASVFNHRFMWKSYKQKPQGRINLLHTLPLNEDIYQELLSIKTGDTVKITGREILRMDAMINGDSTGWWEDDGCNTMIVTDVEIINP